jgi:hypothetical protein
LTLACALGAQAAFSSDALAATGWWHVDLSARPSSLLPGTARNEVRELTVSATGGEFALRRAAAGIGEEPSSPVLFKFDATAEEVATGLDGLYGAGAVEVSGGPGKYVITFVGPLADQPAVPLAVDSADQTLTGGEERAEVTQLTAGQPDGELVASVENIGDSAVEGGVLPVTFAETLPLGLRAVGIAASRPASGSINQRAPLSCSLETLSCELTSAQFPYEAVEVRVAVVAESASFAGGNLEARVSGGGVQSVSKSRFVSAGPLPTAFGVDKYELSNEEEGGAAATQAGLHPFQQTTSVVINQGRDLAPLPSRPIAVPPELPRDFDFQWPAGLIGNPTALPRCNLGDFLHSQNGASEDGCEGRTAVGTTLTTVYEPATFGTLTFTTPLFNLEPARGEPARFGFFVPLANVPVVIDTAVRSGGDYGVTIKVHNVSQTANLLSSVVTVWGVPGDPRHDNARGWGCLYASHEVPGHSCSNEGINKPPAFLTLPTSCGQQLSSQLSVDSWTQPGNVLSVDAGLPALDGCNQVPFDGSLHFSPTTHAGSSPTGAAVDVHVPPDEPGAGSIGKSALRDITVTLPEGVTLNPAAANGLQACSEAQAGYLPGASASPLDLRFTPDIGQCPESSKVGTAKIRTPLLPAGEYLEGGVYLATPAPLGQAGTNPFRSLVAMYMIAEDPVSGVVVKLAGEVSLDPSSGRITTRFRNNPELAFEDAELTFFGGDDAPLVTPAHCGTYAAEATLAPWSGNAPTQANASFDVISGAGGAPCPGVVPGNPSFAASSSSNRAGAFNEFTTTIGRPDGTQELLGAQVHLPPGISAVLAGVPLCGEAEANAGACPSSSLIGHASASVGAGEQPYVVNGGQVFLTGPYRGAPFGLSIVTPAKAGPFDLGIVVVRAKLEVDPVTAAATVTTDRSGPFRIPRILDGIPLAIKQVVVHIDRPGFTFNPTNCGPLAVSSDIYGYEGAVSARSARFQVDACRLLKFAPKLSVATSGQPSKQRGESLIAKLVYPNAPLGTQANIAKVKVSLPKQLPSRLTTLQKACLANVFAANPARCPAASIIGHAKVNTPLLPLPLTGPAYFVSYGNEAFPSLVMVLQGDGVTVQLTGSTLIRKGITSTTFNTVPDVPFSKFELVLPQGPFSALASNGKPCREKLLMPTEYVAQNGVLLKTTPKVAAQGCSKHKKHHAKKHRSKRRKKH